jgi:predicted transcriptional regulator of viral defense system
VNKKNYFSPQEQEVWELLQDKELLDHEQLHQVFPEYSPHKIDQLLSHLHKKKYLWRVRKGLYYNPRTITNFYLLALKLKEGYIGLSSALRYHNLLDYEDFIISIITQKFRKSVKLEGTQYVLEFLPLRPFAGFEKNDNIYVSTPEKTLFDCFLRPNQVGYPVLTQAIYQLRSINWKEFLSYFSSTNNSSLYQRTGYILEMMKKELKLKVPVFVLKFLANKVKTPVKLVSGINNTTFNPKWKVQDNLGKERILSWRY